MDISTSTSGESQFFFDLLTPQLVPTDKPLRALTSKNSSTSTIEEDKETCVHVAIQSLKDHINSLENQLKDKQKIIDGLFNLNSCQCSCNSNNRNHQEQKLADSVKGLPILTNDIIKADISTNNNEDILTENIIPKSKATTNPT